MENSNGIMWIQLRYRLEDFRTDSVYYSHNHRGKWIIDEIKDFFNNFGIGKCNIVSEEIEENKMKLTISWEYQWYEEEMEIEVNILPLNYGMFGGNHEKEVPNYALELEKEFMQEMEDSKLINKIKRLFARRG